MRLAALALLVLLAPTALAQVAGPLEAPQLTVHLNDPGGTGLLPGSMTIFDLIVNYNPPQSARPAPTPTLERPEDTQPTRITIAVKAAPSWFDNVTFDPPELAVAMSPAQVGGTRSSHVRAFANISPTAPANVRELFAVTVTAEPNGAIQGNTADSADDFRPRARVVGALNVTAAPDIVVAGGRWTSIPFLVRNDGNSAIVAKVNVTVRPENSQVDFLTTLELDHSETKTVDVRIRVPWTNAEFGSLELEAVPIVDGEPGDVARAEVAVRGESAVPAPAAAPIIALIVAILLGRRQ